MVKARHCARCKVEIPVERLEALPDTRLCVKCSKEVGGEFDVSVTQENLAKAGSLKKNYGGVEVKKTRMTIKPLD